MVSTSPRFPGMARAQSLREAHGPEIPSSTTRAHPCQGSLSPSLLRQGLGTPGRQSSDHPGGRGGRGWSIHLLEDRERLRKFQLTWHTHAGGLEALQNPLNFFYTVLGRAWPS